MSEYDEDNKISENEINRIQQEIEKDLYKASAEPVQTENATPPQDDSQLNNTPVSLDASNDNNSINPHSIESNVAVSPIFEDKQPAPERETFYRETIKNESYKNSKTRFNRIIAIVLVLSIFGGLSVGLGISVGPSIAKTFFADGKSNASENETAFAFKNKTDASAKTTETSGSSESDQKETDLSNSFDKSLPDFVKVVNIVEPSVVNIATKSSSVSDFFEMPYESASVGSGIIFDEDSEKIFIVTNAHVVNGAEAVSISVEGSKPVVASAVGIDVQADLAVVSIKKTDLKSSGVEKIVIADFGDSDKMQVGEWVLAIGNALGEGNTATAGIVSAKDKKINIQDRVLTVIQTNAAINPGNSGGPLVNMDGEVIGINTAKLTESSVEGMGYSITSNKAKPIIEELRNQTSKPFLGIEGIDITAETAKLYQLPEAGVFVNSVVKGSSAEAAGIKRTDIITVFNGKTVFSMEQLSGYIKDCKVGDTVEIHILRDGEKEMTITVKLAQFSNTKF